MAPRSKGPRVQLNVRMKVELRDALLALAAMHDQAMNDDLIAALQLYVKRHDAKICLRCAELKERR